MPTIVRERERIRWLRMAIQSKPHIELPRARKWITVQAQTGEARLKQFLSLECIQPSWNSSAQGHHHTFSRWSLPSRDCTLSLRHPAGSSPLPLTAGMQATTRPTRGQHSHRTRTPHRHWRVAVQEPTPFLLVKTHSYFSSIKTIILPCQLEARY